MKFGVRECCDVVFRAKSRMPVGNKVFFKNEPVIRFDTLTTSTLEGAVTTVYAQGGRGNPRLISWDGDRTVTFTMEDALISAESFMILSGAGLIEATEDKPIYQHMIQTVDAGDVKFGTYDAAGGTFTAKAADAAYDATQNAIQVSLSEIPYIPEDKGENFAYITLMKDGEPISEAYIPVHKNDNTEKTLIVANHDCYVTGDEEYTSDLDGTVFGKFDAVQVDFYVARKNAKQIDIAADSFGGNFYVEASTLFRNTAGVDLPAEFIIPNARVQSNFTFTMAATGDPSTFTFTMDAFPDYTRFDASKKVLAALQIIETDASMESHRGKTNIGEVSWGAADAANEHVIAW